MRQVVEWKKRGPIALLLLPGCRTVGAHASQQSAAVCLLRDLEK
jgi:hypothetical protein